MHSLAVIVNVLVIGTLTTFVTRIVMVDEMVDTMTLVSGQLICVKVVVVSRVVKSWSVMVMVLDTDSVMVWV